MFSFFPSKFVQIGRLLRTTKQKKNRPQNAGKCVRESKISKFPGGGGMLLDPRPRKEGLPKIIPACYAELPTREKFIETPECITKSFLIYINFKR